MPDAQDITATGEPIITVAATGAGTVATDPSGRELFYEGDAPKEFRSQLVEEFGFDPGADPGWFLWVDDEIGYCYRFRCPAEHLDAVYGSDRWELGS